MIPQVVAAGLVTGCIYALLAVGFSIIANSMSFFNLSHGGILLVGAFLTYFFKVQLNLAMILSIALATVVTTLAFLGIAASVFMPMRARGSAKWNVAMASLGVFIVTQAVIGIVFGTAPVDATQGNVPRMFQLVGVRISTTEITIAVVAVASILLFSVFVRATKVGMAVRAAVNDREIAGLVGANVERLEMVVFGIGAFLAALAGGLVAMTGAVTYTMGLDGLLKAIVVSILGIEAGVAGALVGGLALGVIENVTMYATAASWRDGISLLILMAYIFGTTYVRRMRKDR
jgi:branched-subunit amino acid ABC-type transport system permease component